MNRSFMRGVLLVAITAGTGCEGDAGPAGLPGEDGVVNVSSGTFSIAAAAFTNGFWHMPVAGGTQANPARVATVPVAALTSDIITNGAVFVYLHTPSTPTGPLDHWTLLPFHQGGFGGGYLVSIKAALRAGEIRVGYSHESTGPTAPPDVYAVTLPTFEFRWVAIKATVAGAVSASIAQQGPDAVISHAQRTSGR